jgi:alpha-glucosidase
MPLLRKILAVLVLFAGCSQAALGQTSAGSAAARSVATVQKPAITVPPNQFAKDAEWWKRAVFYEIYPRSYADTDNDGVGDLQGITRHLDHLQALGVDAIWITPCFRSPQVDFGYDVSDYRDIDPQYGTLAEMERLITEADKRDIKVVLDFVMNHSSDQHKWFLESKKSRDNPYRDYYVWRDGRGPGQPPNNWISLFGGPGWTYDPTTDQWYHHYFYPQQPDLNWSNPRVEQEMFDIVRYWFKKGVYGFRLDAVDTLFEDPDFRDNPNDPGTNAYGDPNQRHVMDSKLRQVHTQLQKLRSVVDEFHGRVLVGETWTNRAEELADYYGPKNNEVHMPMYFNLTVINQLSPAAFREKIKVIESNPVGGWPVYVLSNHDIRRHIDRYGDGQNNDKIAKLMAALYLTLRGTPVLYYGEEIGMENNDPKRREDVKDVIGQRGWPQEKGRDGERTPMQWNTGPNAGFNDGATAWLPVHENYKRRNVEAQTSEPKSMLNWYRQLITLRRTHPAFYEGAYLPLLEDNPSVLAYARKSKNETAVVLLNMTAARQTVSLSHAQLGGSLGKSLVRTSDAKEIDLRSVTLEPFEVVIAEVGSAH